MIENIAYFPAHLRLAVVAMRSADTVSALTELGRALVVKDDDYAVQLTMGQYLLSLGRHDSAAAHLRRAAELEPYAAAPPLALGRALDAARQSQAAALAYDRFLALCRRDDADAASVRARVAALRAPDR